MEKYPACAPHTTHTIDGQKRQLQDRTLFAYFLSFLSALSFIQLSLRLLYPFLIRAGVSVTGVARLSCRLSGSSSIVSRSLPSKQATRLDQSALAELVCFVFVSFCVLILILIFDFLGGRRGVFTFYLSTYALRSSERCVVAFSRHTFVHLQVCGLSRSNSS